MTLHDDPRIEPKGGDELLQPDPYLQEGRAGIGRIVLTAAGALAIVAITLYGLTHQPREAPQLASAPAPAAGSAPAPAAEKNAQDKSAQQAGQKGAAPPATTGSGEAKEQPKEQQPATARPQESGAQR